MVTVTSNTVTSDLPTHQGPIEAPVAAASDRLPAPRNPALDAVAVEGDAEVVLPDSSRVLPAVVDPTGGRELARPRRTTAERIAASVPAETSRARRTDWADWTTWCKKAKRSALPTGDSDLADYANHLAEKMLAPATIERRLSTILTAHRAAGHVAPDTLGARAVLKAWRTEYADAGGRRRKATAITIPVLRRLVDTCDPDTMRGRRDRAVLLLGFALGARRSTLSRLNVGEVAVAGPHELDVWLRRSKTDQAADGKAVTIPSGSDPATCPVRAWEAWRADLDAAGLTLNPLAPAFHRFDRRGRLSVADDAFTNRGAPDGRISGQAVGIIVKRAAQAAGIDETGLWSAHGLRRGYATAAHDAGAEVLTIGRHGEGWVDGSRALFGYIDDARRRTNNPLNGIGL